MEGARPLPGDILKNTNCHPFGDAGVSATSSDLNLSAGMPVIRGLSAVPIGKGALTHQVGETRERGRLLTAALGWNGWRVLARLGGRYCAVALVATPAPR